MKRTLLVMMMSLFALNSYAQTSELSKDYRRSIKLYQKHKYARAIRQCIKAFEKNEGSVNADAQIFLGNLYYANQEYKEAQKAYLEAIQSLKIGSDKVILLQNYIARAKVHIKHSGNNCHPNNSIQEDLKNDLIYMSSNEKIESLDKMATYRGCEKEETATATDKCLHYYINDLVTYNFDDGLYDAINWKGHAFIGGHFTIEKDGSLSDIQPFSSHPLFELEAIRILQSITDIEPAIYDGNAVRLRENLHVHL
ncbi:tol-pal system YbgF family protein [Nonlabens ponticola]|uniref:Tetratricopeptide repeat protein n=1 Tax=Nonlabens ponticola TaxID=2496866 RepID=A0A3S9MYI9_9FLAO|nr:hypothetical protein [Nonlabens ponticola]AZQ44311.1 hypothetical protein EJ995_08705 [Nonlabens ponticola]